MLLVNQTMLIRQKIVRQTLLVLYFLLSYDGVQGETKLSKLEYLELEKQLKLLNKPAVKIIKTKYGDTYGCVDFYKQPAFDHPSLKNHNFHHKMKPTLVRTLHNSTNLTAIRSSSIWLKEESCPFGTVPIKRVTKEDLIRQRHIPPPEAITFEDQLTNINNNSELKRSYISRGVYKLAIVRVSNNPKNKFAGAGMSASIYNPQVEGQQHSGCRLKISKGSDILQVGWRVDPTLYNDNNTRLYIHFQAGNTHCFNTLCPGFILVNTGLPVDMVFDEVNHRGYKSIVEIQMYIDRDVVGNWWLLIGENYEQVGFWSRRIFTDLASFANHVDLGGVAYSPPGVLKPPMGSSCLPMGNPGYDGYCRRLDVVNDKGETINTEKTIARVDDAKLYDVIDSPDWRYGEHEKFQHIVFYGGPGEVETWC